MAFIATFAPFACACTAAADARFAASAASVGTAEVGPGGQPPAVWQGPNVVGQSCDTGACQASCLSGSTILLAYGFHGRTFDSSGPTSPKCGEGVEWMGACLGQESCSISTSCATSALYLICR